MSVTLQITLGTISTQEARAVIAMLNAIQDPVEIASDGPTLAVAVASPLAPSQAPAICCTPAPAKEVAAVEPVDPTSVPTSDPAPVPAPESEPATTAAKKRGRPAKKEVAPTTPSEVAVEPVDPPVASADTSTPAPASDAPTLDMLREAVQRHIEKRGYPAAKALLKEFACSRVAEMVENAVEQQMDFIRRCNV